MEIRSVFSESQKTAIFNKGEKIEGLPRKLGGYVQKRSTMDTANVTRRAEKLINAASNRYRITVQVANRAKRRRYEDFENMEDPMKPVLRAIVEMSEELDQPEIIGD